MKNLTPFYLFAGIAAALAAIAYLFYRRSEKEKSTSTQSPLVAATGSALTPIEASIPGGATPTPESTPIKNGGLFTPTDLDGGTVLEPSTVSPIDASVFTSQKMAY